MRIVEVAAHSDDLSSVIGLDDDPAADGILRVIISIVHDRTHIHAEDCRIVAADRLGVGLACLVIPVASVPEVVMVTEHEALCGNVPQICIKRLCLSRSILVCKAQGRCNLDRSLVSFLRNPGLLIEVFAGRIGEFHLAHTVGCAFIGLSRKPDLCSLDLVELYPFRQRLDLEVEVCLDIDRECSSDIVNLHSLLNSDGPFVFIYSGLLLAVSARQGSCHENSCSQN